MSRLSHLERQAHRHYRAAQEALAPRGERILELLMKESDLISKCLKKVPEESRGNFIVQRSEFFNSACGTSRFRILWGPTSQVITRYLVNGDKTLIQSCWSRRAFTFEQKKLLREELRKRFFAPQ